MAQRRCYWIRFVPGILAVLFYLYVKKDIFSYIYVHPLPQTRILIRKIPTTTLKRAFHVSVIDWLKRLSKDYGLVILNVTSVQCLAGDLISCNKTANVYRFALVSYNGPAIGTPEANTLHRIVSRSLDLGWKQVQRRSDGLSAALLKSDVLLKLSIMEFRPRYIYLNGMEDSDVEEDKPRAFLNLNFEKYEFDTDAVLFAPHPIDFYVWQWPRSRYLQCNRTSGEYLRRKHPHLYNSRPVIRPWSLHLLAYCQEVLTRNRVTPLLEGGTVLGWYRECGVIPHTNDLDMTFVADEWKPRVMDELFSDSVVTVVRIIGRAEDSLELMLTYGDTRIDLFGLYNSGNYSYTAGMIISNKTQLAFMEQRFNGACTCDLKGHLFYVRCNTLDYLITLYGTMWYEHILSADYTWYKSPQNVHTIRTYSESEWPLVLRQFDRSA